MQMSSANAFLSGSVQNIVVTSTEFNSLPNDKILVRPKLKAFADDNLNVGEMIISLRDRVENIVGKKRKCWQPAFSLFPSMFSNGFFHRVVKIQNCLGKRKLYQLSSACSLRKGLSRVNFLLTFLSSN